MPLYVIDPEAVLAFRRNHRRQVQRSRAIKRRKQAEKVRERKPDDIDKAFADAINRDRS